MTLKDQLRAELEETRQAYHALLAEVTENDWDLPSANPAWTLGEMLYHITVATQNIPLDVALVRRTPWLPNPPIGLLHMLNGPLTRYGANQHPRAALAEKFDRDHAALLALLETVREDEWAKGRTYHAYDPPHLKGFVTVATLFHYQKYHFEQHAKDIHATLNLLRVARGKEGAGDGKPATDELTPDRVAEPIPDAPPTREMLPYPDGGVQRWLFRTPIPLWRLGLEPLIGQVMMLVTHVGRKTGQIRRTMIEYHPRQGVKYAVAAWGEKADWYRNILADPYVTIQTASGTQHVKAERVTDPHELLACYTLFMRRDPPLTRWYLHSRSISLDDPADFLAKKDRVHLVRFAPAVYPSGEPTLPPVRADLKWVLPAFGATLLAAWFFLRKPKK
ncbi:MAG: nitroreductase family deazaflavin-dependent oxidoreductase [Anaerolineales bacterium]|nr:nitroreductase family deazaflavin-dependent oxidoreductase [Anaerolineales bacterium]